MRENRTYGSEGGEASAFPTLSGYRDTDFLLPANDNTRAPPFPKLNTPATPRAPAPPRCVSPG